MDRNEFLNELCREGIIMYGVTWEANLKRIQELEKYKHMWEDFERFHKEHPNDYLVLSTNDVYGVLQNIKQKYFPKPKKEIIKLLEELDNKVKELLRFV